MSVQLPPYLNFEDALRYKGIRVVQLLPSTCGCLEAEPLDGRYAVNAAVIIENPLLW